MNKSDDFKTKGFFVDSLPDASYAELNELSQNLETIPEECWTQVIRSDGETKDLPWNADDTRSEHDKAFAQLDNGELCYSFRRIAGTDANFEVKAVRDLKEFLLSPEIREFIYDRTGRRVEEISLFYVNRFAHGDFLTTHCDSGDNLALVINLTHQWAPNNGGITFLLDREDNILRALNPRFGQALLLDCSKNTVPHFVSAVSSPTGRYRTAVVARYA